MFVRLLIALTIGVPSALPAMASDPIRLAFVQAPVSETRPAGRDLPNTILGGRYATGMTIVLAMMDNVAGTGRTITEGFVCATDPVFSHDGRKLAFAGQRRADEPLQIWELEAGKQDARPLGDCSADAAHPVYMPSGHVVFASLLAGEYEEHGGQFSFSLYESTPEGGPPTRLTFNPSSEFDPVVLPDGRLLYSSWQHVGNHFWPRGVVALILVNSDGTGVFPLTGNHRGPWLKRGARPFGADGIAFVQSDGHGAFGAGTLVTTSLNDAFAPYQTLVPRDAYEVADAAPIPDGRFVLSARPANGSRSTFGLYLLEGDSVRLLYDDPDRHELAPAIGAAGPPPQTRISTVVPETPHGYILVLNCYETDRQDQYPLPPGSIGLVRLLEGLSLGRDDPRNQPLAAEAQHEGEPLIQGKSATGYLPSRIVGEMPPAADGSVFMKVPADRPLRLQLIDRDGFALMNERAWFWVRPNERRVCIGCHENRELTPNNATADAARRRPTDLTDPGGWQTVSFPRDIQPILEARCATAGCHVAPKEPLPGMFAPPLSPDEKAVFFMTSSGSNRMLEERFGPAYVNLLMRQNGKSLAVGGRRVHPGDARSSPLLWILYGRKLGRPSEAAPFDESAITEHPGPMLTEAELDLMRKWVDLGAAYGDEPLSCEPPPAGTEVSDSSTRPSPSTRLEVGH